jgi:hypothetical protein
VAVHEKKNGPVAIQGGLQGNGPKRASELDILS